jgi:hypothetical protein
VDDNNPNLEPDDKATEIACIRCGNLEILEGYPNKLCLNCRESLIKFPIPLWVKLFGTGVALVMLISIIWLPKNLQAAIALSRAERAEKKFNYITEQQELEKAKKTVPGSIDILAHLVIASFYNGDFKTLDSASNALENKNIEDTALFNKASYVMTEIKSYAPTEPFVKAFEKYKNSSIPDTAYQQYLKKNPEDVYAIYSLAASYSNEEKYVLADSMLSRTLTVQPSFFPAMQQKTMVKRELNQLDSSLYYCDKLLAENNQHVFALSSKARTLLKSRKNSEGLNFALQAYKLDENDPYNLATMAVAYHFNKNYKQRDALISLSQKDSALSVTMGYAKDIISGKIKFQN